MTRTQERILAGLAIAISLAAIGVSIRTERTLDALEAMRAPAPGPDDLVIDSDGIPIGALPPGANHVWINGTDYIVGSLVTDPADSGYVAKRVEP